MKFEEASDLEQSDRVHMDLNESAFKMVLNKFTRRAPGRDKQPGGEELRSRLEK